MKFCSEIKLNFDNFKCFIFRFQKGVAFLCYKRNPNEEEK